MRIAIRLDDITPDMDWQKFDRFKNMMEEAHVLPLIGVVPISEDKNLHIDTPRDDFWELVKKWEKSGWTIAMHGHNHVYTTKKGGLFPLNHLSEFAGLSFERQNEKISEGRKILEAHGISTDIFMAPAHSYDKNTLRALRANGFTKITDGFGTSPYTREGITFYPISFNRSQCLTDSSDDPTTFVVHTNTMTDADFAFYEKLFREQKMLPYSDYLKIPAKQQGILPHAGEVGLASGKRIAGKLLQMRNKK